MGLVANVLGTAARWSFFRSKKSRARKVTPASAIHGAPATKTDPTEREGLVPRALWAAESGANLLDRLVATARGNFPSFAHSISVACRGGPEADLRRIWYLTCAAAFGRYRNRARGVQSAMLEATWDVTGKACSITIGYENNGLATLIDSGLGIVQRGPDQVTVGGSWPAWAWTKGQVVAAAAGGGVLGGLLRILRPDAFGGGVVVGGALAGAGAGLAPMLGAFGLAPGTLPGFWSPVLYNCGTSGVSYPVAIFLGSDKGIINPVRELPRNDGTFLPWRRVLPRTLAAVSFGSALALSGRVPLLPDDGRIITTGEKRDPRVQNPKPQIDGLSRNTLVSLVSQALQQPCLLPTPVPCSSVIPQAAGSPGLFVYPPGGGTALVADDNTALSRIVDLPAGAAGAVSAGTVNPAIGPDGYPLMAATALNLRQ